MQEMIILLILGIIDLVAGVTLFIIAPMDIVKAIAVIVLIKGIWSVAKYFFRF